MLVSVSDLLVVLCLWLDVSMLCMRVVFFFFKQKTAYEMLRSLVGSEMCIRDRHGFHHRLVFLGALHLRPDHEEPQHDEH